MLAISLNLVLVDCAEKTRWAAMVREWCLIFVQILASWRQSWLFRWLLLWWLLWVLNWWVKWHWSLMVGWDGVFVTNRAISCVAWGARMFLVFLLLDWVVEHSERRLVWGGLVCCGLICLERHRGVCWSFLWHERGRLEESRLLDRHGCSWFTISLGSVVDFRRWESCTC